MSDFTGLKLVFMGQIGDDPYSEALRTSFKDADFLPTIGAVGDFETIRKAKQILVPLSTFAWLAAWMSDASRIILPVFGLFNPQQWPQHDLLPIGDARYMFFQFPPHNAVPVEQYERAHAELSWVQVSAPSLLRA